MKSLRQYITESGYSIETGRYGSIMLPFIIVDETPKSFVVKWRTRSEERTMRIAKKALYGGHNVINKPDKSEWYTFWYNPYKDVLPDYKMLNVQYWYIDMIRAGTEDPLFFDDWNTKVRMLDRKLHLDKKEKQANTNAKRFIKLVKHHKLPINIDWIEITQSFDLMLKSNIGMIPIEVDSDRFLIQSNDLILSLHESDIELSSMIVRQRPGYYDYSMDNPHMRDILIEYALTGKVNTRKVVQSFETAMSEYDPDYQKGAMDRYYAEQEKLYRQLRNIARYFEIRIGLKLPI